MSNIDKQALREAAERAESDSWGYDRDEFNEALTPSTVLALLDELEAADRRCAALAAENAELKHAMAVTLEHVSVTDTGQAGVAAMIINDALHHSGTPATDAFLAEVRAQGVGMAACALDDVNQFNYANMLDDLAQKIRKGVI